ncbi:preprotein translocase subunit SecA [Eisenibacter elegans]|jgi:preprotein translocase subunit SecA|uniref:preprotein translocase subunit SecA n=1 Tax=Eisenibacter elegans TaxID=997 RepID=UPI000408AC27|nr:preprotein translocase subunit SecA [Eisenibacter elegans]
MSNLVTKVVTKLFGSKYERDLKRLLPYVTKVNQEWATLQSISPDELRQRSADLRAHIADQLQSIDTQISDLQAQAAESTDLSTKEAIFAQIDSLEDKRNERLEEVLIDILPKAFAIVKETARRFKENKQLRVQANMHDRQIAARKANVEINGETAIWHNSWQAAGNTVTWDMLHYDVQIIGGVVLHEGKIAEMATGEGKTLVATLPAFLNALAGRGVHIVTVNDYLAKRDSEWMAPIFEFHGMIVDCIDKYEPNSEERKAAYRADITYGTNNEFGFDYLRDNMAREIDQIVQRRHHYAMIDEVDSVLIDDARTPLIISGPIPRGDEHEYYELKPRIQRVVEEQKKVVQNFLSEAKRLVKEGKEKDAGLPLFRAFRGLPKNKPLIKFLSEPGMRTMMQKVENYYLQDNARQMPEADQPLYFTIDEKNNQIDLTEKGLEFITGNSEDPSFFILPDIGVEINNIEEKADLSEEEKLAQKEAVINDYSIKAQRIHAVNQLLKAYALFEREVDYIIVDGKVKIVDEQTGRVMEGRRYSDGLHQALEAKENVKIEDATQTYATITLQNYFRMYHKLSGMTGTAETEASEFWEIYKLDVTVIPTNVPIARKDEQDLVFKTIREKFNAVAEEVVRLTEQGRPVLVGTTSVEISELLSRMLTIRKIKHQVLNAKLHQKEAEIVAEAGKPGTVTIATNMAGRGTDIKLTPESKSAGGLAIIGTERHESRRVDRQLRGRSGRQGDPGSSQFFVSLEDDLMRRFGSDRIAKFMDRMGFQEGEVIQHSMITKSIERAQKKVEENNFGIRKRLLEYDDVMNAQREIVYKRRHTALHGERLEVDILNMLYQTSEDIAQGYQGEDAYESFKLAVYTNLGIELPVSLEQFSKVSAEQLTDLLYQGALRSYKAKNDRIAEQILPILEDIRQEKGAVVEEIVVPFTDGKRQINVAANLQKACETQGQHLIKSMEKNITLALIDQLWKEHLREMDDLKQSVQMAVHEQKDPLLVYKFEAFQLFSSFVSNLNRQTVSFLLKADVPRVEPNQMSEARPTPRRQQPKLRENKPEFGGNTPSAPLPTAPMPERIAEPIKSDKTIGRNDKVTVQYTDGSIKKDVKYKTVEQDLKNNRCVIID